MTFHLSQYVSVYKTLSHEGILFHPFLRPLYKEIISHHSVYSINVLIEAAFSANFKACVVSVSDWHWSNASIVAVATY